MVCIGSWVVIGFVLTRPNEIYLGGAKNKIISSPTVHFGLTEVFGGLFISLRGVGLFLFHWLVLRKSKLVLT